MSPRGHFLGDTAAGLDSRALQASPLEQVTASAPPMLLIHGDDDAWVPLDQSVADGAVPSMSRASRTG